MKRIFALLLAMVMVLGMVPVSTIHVHATEVQEPVVEETAASETMPVAETEPATEETEPVVTEPETVATESVADVVEPAAEAPAENVQTTGIISGTIDGLVWEITDDNVLKITGSGAIPDYEYDEAPWSEHSWDIIGLELDEGITRIGNYAFAFFNLWSAPKLPDSVTSIGDYAFRACSGLTGMKLPNGLVSIGEYAFDTCNLTEITIPAGITHLPDGVFYNCRQLRNVELPATLESIGGNAFAQCVSLEAVDFPEGMTTLGDTAFSWSGLKTVKIPDSLTDIGEDAFSFCENLESVELPNTLTVLKSRVFCDNPMLKTITLPDSLTTIYAAFNSGGLTEITIPASVQMMSGTVFAYCKDLQSVTFEGHLPKDTENPYSYPLSNVFLGTTTTVYYNGDDSTWDEVVGRQCGGQITWVPYPCEHKWQTPVPGKESTCTEQGYSAHYICDMCDKLLQEDGVTVTTMEELLLPLADHMFQGNVCAGCGLTVDFTCGENATWSIAGGVLTISGEGRMYDYRGGGPGWQEFKQNITSVVFEEGITYIGAYAFYNYDKLETVVMSSTITEIGDSAFESCDALKNITYSENLERIGMCAFDTCTSLESVDLPGKVKYIGDYAYYNCNNVCSITLPETLETICYYAFYRCEKVKEIFIPASVVFIGEYAFQGTTSLEAYTVDSKNLVYSNDSKGVLYNKDKSELVLAPSQLEGSYTIPKGVKVIGTCAFYECAKLTKISIPSSVRQMLWQPFARCENLESITVDAGNGYFSSVNGVLFNKNKTTLIQVPLMKTGSYAVPSTVTTIDTSAFEASKLSEVTLPASLEYIRNFAFRDCEELEIIKFKGDAPDIEYQAFENITVTCMYPEGNETWNTTITRWFYDCELTWISYPVNLCENGHTGGTELRDVKEATCTEKGYTGDTYCVGCGEQLSTGKSIAALGHKYVKTVVAPGVVTPGYTEYVCSRCNDSYRNAEKAPLGLSKPAPKAVASAEGLAVLSWNAVEYADAYTISRATKKTGTYTDIATVEENTYTDDGVTIGATYYYKVKAVYSENTQLNSAYSAVVSVNILSEAPQISVHLDTATGKPQLTWGAAEGAKKYDVYRATSETGKYSKVKTVTTLGYLDTGASVGKTYFYKVKSVASSSTYNSAYSNVASCYAVCAQPKVTAKLIAATGKPELTWSKVTGASQYQILRATAIDGEYVSLATQKSTSYKDTNVVVDTEYFYKVNAIASNTANNSVDATPVAITASVAQPAIKTTASDVATGKPILTWEAIDGAAEYEISRSTKSSGTYESVGTTAELTFLDETAAGGKTYYYKVTAITEKGTRSVVSSYKSVKSICAAPVIEVQMDTATGKPQITWNGVEGAKKYDVYRATTENGKYSKTKTVTTLSYIDTGASVGKTYFYKVKTAASSSSYNSAYSNSGSSYVICGQPVVTVKISSKGLPELSWKKVSGASQYQILRATEIDGQYEVLKTQTSTTYKPVDQEFDTAYFYKINAIAKNTANNSVDATPILVVAACAQPAIKTAAADYTTGKPVLTWNAVANAVNYEISRSTKSSGTYEVIGTTAELTFLDEGAEVDKTYYYKLTALGNNSRSLASSYKSVKCKLAIPAPSVALNENGKPQISWETVEGAKKYEVYRATSANGKYSKVTTTTALRYVDTKASAGKTYFYKVKAIASSSSANSNYSLVVSITAE